MIGASVSVKGTIVGAFTNADGNFTLKVKELPVRLSITAIGYPTVELEVKQPNQVIDVKLNETVGMLNEVKVAANRVEESLTESPVSVEKPDIRKSGSLLPPPYTDPIPYRELC